MYSKTPTGKASKGSVQILVSNGRLQLRFRFGGNRHYLSLGYSDTPVHRKLAEAKARQIELDILSGNFDQSLIKYKPESALSTVTPKFTPDTPSILPLKDLWQSYVEYKSPNASPKTINGTYEPVAAHLSKCSTDGLENALKFRMELLQVTTESQARRTLMQLSAACNWGMRHGLVPSNPLNGMYKELEASKAAPPISFTVEERDCIIQAFETHCGKGINYQHYAPFIKFLFWSGCRPCEAIGLRWGSIKTDCSKIHFHESIVEVSGKLTRRNETKTGKERWFSCYPKLQDLLLSLRPDNSAPDALVFPAPKGGAISETNLNQRGWSTVLTSLKLAQKEGVKMTLYNCRDTFITLQAIQGTASNVIARWVGNTADMIDKKYLDKMKLDHLKPHDI